MNIQHILSDRNYINGEFVSAGERLPVYHKYSGEHLADVPLAGVEQVEEAVRSASASFGIFKKYSAEKRAGILEELYRLLSENSKLFTRLIAAEAGKPVTYASSEVNRALENIRNGIRETLLFAGERVPMDFLNGKNKTAYTVRQAPGPVLGITPFNFPLNLPLHKIIPAIAVGAPVIIKPAPQAPLTMLALAKLLRQTELPAGAVNILMTGNDNTLKMVEDERIKILSFTGSDKTGWLLKSRSGKKKTLLEMGGNAAAIVDDTARITRAARKLAYGSFLYAGQICISTQRIYVDSKVYDVFVREFLNETAKLKSGDMFDENVINSSMISAADFQRIGEWVEEAVRLGAKVLAGGKPYDEKARIYEMTVLTHTDNSMKIHAEEAFAPVVCIEPFENFDKAIEKVNDSRYGLQAGVFTDSLNHVLKAQENLEVGGVIINDVPGFRMDSMPYGGIKNSGMGREGTRYAMMEYTESKLIVIG